MENIKFSIIMPTYNRSNILMKSIESVLHQTYSNWELIIVDDNSDEYHKILNEKNIKQLNDDRIHYYYLTSNHKHCYARNYGVEHSNGEWIKYLDDDNVILPTCLFDYLKVIDDYSNVITSKFALINTDTNEYTEKGEDFSKVNIFKSCQLDTCAFIHRRKLYDIFGGWDERLYRMADDDIIFRYVTKDIKHYRFLDKVTASCNIRTSIKRVTTNVGNIKYLKIIRDKFDDYFKKKCLIVTNTQSRLNDLLSNDYESDKFINADILCPYDNEYDFVINGNIKKYYIYDNYDYILLYNDDNINVVNELFKYRKIYQKNCNIKNSWLFKYDLTYIIKNNLINIW